MDSQMIATRRHIRALDNRITELEKQHDGDDYHELDKRIHAQEERITELESKLDQTIEGVRELGLVIEVMATWHREEMTPLMQRQDYLEALTMRLKGASNEDIRDAKALAELRSAIHARSEAEELMATLRAQ